MPDQTGAPSATATSASPVETVSASAATLSDSTPRSASSAAVRRTLRDTFGLSRLRPGQKEVIDSILKRRDTLAVMPTGSGKSLCYQLPALNMQGMTIVVSPLISLMKDQAEKLAEAGIDAAQLNSTLSTREEAETIRSIDAGESKFVFTTPERLATAEFMATLQGHQVGIFVIDEAHCISQWGHDFRPAYLALGAALDALGRPPVLALTATATEKVAADIATQLGLAHLEVINTGIYRENLQYRVVHVTSQEEKLAAILALVADTEGSGIIYAATVKNAERLHEALVASGQSAALYHGKMTPKQRHENQDRFMHGEARVMVATNAFGMGIDKQDTRFVIHQQIPANLEAYYQESGRAGRDGAPSTCTLFYHLEDKRLQQFFLGRHYPDAESLAAVCTTLKKRDAARRAVSLDALDDAMPELATGRLQVILKLLARGGIVTETEDMGWRLTDASTDADTLSELAAEYAKKRDHDRDALERMVFYAQTGSCRWKVLMDYFGEQADAEHCGTCDHCIAPPEVAPFAEALHDATDSGSPASGESGTSATRDEPFAFMAGDAVRVKKYGEGKVVGMQEDMVHIVFPDGETRTFLRDYVDPA